MNLDQAKEILTGITNNPGSCLYSQRTAIQTVLTVLIAKEKQSAALLNGYDEEFALRYKLQRQLSWMRRTGMIWFAKGVSHNGKKHKWAVLCGSDIYGTGVTSDAAIEDARKRHPLRSERR